MIYSPEQLNALIISMIAKPENEVVEFKEAKTNYSFNDIGKYFSALGNEANIRSKREAWLIFGIKNDGTIVNTDYRRNGALPNLKKEVAAQTNERLTFIEIYETELEGKRVVAFQIPPAIPGIPTTWNGAAYAREGESLCPLPMNKVDLIRSQIGLDWSKEIVEGATIDDLDPEAIMTARKLFARKQQDRAKSQEILESLSDIEVLNKAGITFKGQITNTALLLLGKSESSFYFDGFIPRITWTLYNADNSVKAYEHFDMPFLLAVDRVYGKIRNEKYRYIAGQVTLFPEEVDQYDPSLIKEILNNCIAHSDYRLRGKINIEEYEDRLAFLNEGTFIPETIENALEPGYKPPYYRNAFLCGAMVNLYMIDTNSMGIPMIYRIQKDKCFPLPTYDLDTPNRIKVTVYGCVLDTNYTQLLHSGGDLSIQTVFLLDRVQKKQVISQDSFQELKKQHLVEGRYPNIYVSFKVADAVGRKTDYISNRGLDEKVCRELVIQTLKLQPASMPELLEVLDRGALSGVLSEKQKARKVSYLLQKMKNDGIIRAEGIKSHAIWHLNTV